MSTAVRGARTRAPDRTGERGAGDERAEGAVDLHGVTKRYGPETAVDALDLHVPAGEFISLLGPSGCGKTTTLRMIAGFEQADAGRIEISGDPVEHLPPHRRPVNTVFQAYALFPHMDVAENVAYGLRQARVPRAEIGPRVSDALDMVQMGGFARRRPGQLSGGQQQRVALARALVNRPAVLLLDEPMSALDRKLREEMQIELKLLQGRLGITFLFVTHDQEEALTMSDRVAVLDGGHLEQIGTPDDVYDHPASAFVAGFIGRQNTFAGDVESAADAEVGVRVAHGVVLARATVPVGARRGDRAVVSVRPERVRLRTAEEDDAARGGSGTGNGVRGTIAGVSHLGHALQLVVTTEDGADVLVRADRSAGVPTALGTPVVCRWDADATHAFLAPDDGAETAPTRRTP